MTIAILPFAVRRLDAAMHRVLGPAFGVPLLVVVLLAVAAVPPIVEATQQQPLLQSVDDLRDGTSSLSSWVRMNGRIVTLSPPESVDAGHEVHSLLVEPSGDAILLLSTDPIDHLTQITGRVSGSGTSEGTAERIGGERFPADATEVITGYVVRVDDPVVPPEGRTWLPSWTALGIAVLLLLGRQMGYPLVRLQRGPVRPPGAAPLAVGEELAVRVVDPEEEDGTRLRAPAAALVRLSRSDENAPYFAMHLRGQPRPTLFRRHGWSRAAPGTLLMAAQRLPMVHLHDWGVEVILAVDGEAERDRLLASFAVGRDADAEAAEGARTGEPIGA